MDGNYGVYFGKEMMGKVQVIRQGLYYRFCCRCRLTENIFYQLVVVCENNQVNLGTVIPVDGGFGLDIRLPVKRLGEGKLEFYLTAKRDASAQQFVPLSPDEPFAYIDRLKKAYLVRKNGQTGVLI